MKIINELKTGPHGSSLNQPTCSKTGVRRASQLLALGVVISTQSALAQTAGSWATIDDIDPPASATGVATDSAGNVFVAGAITDSAGRSHAVIMRGRATGLLQQPWNWDNDPSTTAEEPSDDYASSDGSAASYGGIASGRQANGGDHVVAVGVAEGSKWLIRRLEADGRWTTLNLFAHPNSKYVLSRPSTIALDGTGSIYVAGNATETVVTYKGTTATTTTVNRPLLRKFESGLWVTINLPASISGIVRVGNNLYSSAGSPDGWWQVRKSTDGGFNWVLVDNFRYDVSSPSGANDIAADGNGNIFVVGSGVRVVTTGTGKTAKTISHRSWIVRKGVAAGTTWATSNVFELGARTDGHGAFNIAQAVTVDQNNNVHVTGFGISDLRRWVTRQLPSGTVVWLTSDNFPYATGYYTSGWGNAADASGNVFSIGSAGNNTGVNRNWLVRGKLVTP